MSMWVNLARVSSSAFAKIHKQPTLLEAIFFDGDDEHAAQVAELGVEEAHTAGFDYQLTYDAMVAMAEATGEEIDEEGDPVLHDLSVSGELDWDAGYGPAFYINPTAVTAAKASMACGMDQEVAAVIEGAAAAGDYLVGVIS